MISDRAPRRLLQKGIGLALLAMLVAWMGWSSGRKTSSPSVDHYQVTGVSMMPTLKGTHRQFVCPNCRVTFATTARIQSQRDTFPCWHCGHQISIASEPVRAGDVVGIKTLDQAPASLRIGQLVAIDWQGQRQIKRVLALPGDTVDIDADRQLLTNGIRLADRLAEQQFGSRPTVSVDFDALRDESRWRPQSSEGWQRVDRQWRTLDSQPPDWLVYRHQAVYDQFQAAPIYDDYPANIDVTRQMNIAQRIFVRLRVEPVEGTGKIQVAFWSREGPVLVQRIVDPDAELELHQRDGTPRDDLPVERTAPVAIRLLGGSATLSQLRVGRDAEYRLNKTHSSARYPVLLASDECYLVGDNVPVSIDSRTLGPAPLDGVIGIVEGGRQK